MAMLPDGNCGIDSSTKEDKMKANVDKLHRMVLGKDNNIDDEYVQKFYTDTAKEVNSFNAGY